jgi:ribosome recycling factor
LKNKTICKEEKKGFAIDIFIPQNNRNRRKKVEKNLKKINQKSKEGI